MSGIRFNCNRHSPPVYVWQCPWDSKMARVWARYSDRIRANPIIAFIVLDPRIKGGHSMIAERRYRWSRPMPDWPHILCRVDAQRPT